MSHQPSRPPPLPGYPSHSPKGSAPYDGSDHGYTSPELSPSFLTATVIPSVDDDEAQTVSHTTHDADSLRTPSALPASAMQATVFGVQRISPAPAAPPQAATLRSPAPAPAAQHMSPALRPAQPRQPTPPSQPAAPNGLSAAAAALADEPTGFLRVSDMPGAAAPGAARGGSTGGPSWLADQPTSWVALQPNPNEAASAGYAASGTPSAAAPRSAASAPAPMLTASPPSTLRPWLLSLGIGLLGGLLALVMIVAGMRYLSNNRTAPADKRGVAADRVTVAETGAIPALVLDDAMRAVQRGDLDRAIDLLKAERSRQANPALDSLIDSLKRLRSSRLH